MKVINLNSHYELTPAQISFIESVIYCGERDRPFDNDSISILANKIPIYLLAPENMPDEDSIYRGIANDQSFESQSKETYYRNDKKPSTEWLGFYQHSYKVLGVNTPIIGLCPERLMNCVNSEEELTYLIAKVIIHELAHAKMKLHPAANYEPVDEFYKWMEEPMANQIALQYFHDFDEIYKYHYGYGRRANFARHISPVSPFDYAKTFVSQQPDNYRLGLDLFNNNLYYWWIWRNCQDDINQNLTAKNDWLNYVRANVGKTDKTILHNLFDALHKRMDNDK